jgi:hypothetical protein
MFSDKYNDIVIRKLWFELHDMKVYEHENELWFINDETNICYFRFDEKKHLLTWNLPFFDDFFQFFSLDEVEYESILVLFVQEILEKKIRKCKWMDNTPFKSTVKMIKRRYL